MIPEEIKQFIPQPARRVRRRRFHVSYRTPGKPQSVSYMPERDGDIPKIAKDLTKRLGVSTRSKMIREAVGDLWVLVSDCKLPPWPFPVLLEDLSLALGTNKSGAIIAAIRWRESLAASEEEVQDENATDPILR